jgi:hypothetical protein
MRWLAALVVTLAFGIAPAAEAARPLPRVPAVDPTITSYGGLEVRPAKINYNGAGAGYLAGAPMGHVGEPPAGGLRWKAWTMSDASGSGYDWEGSLFGPWAHYRVTVHLFRPRRLGGYLVFTRMTYSYQDRRPPGAARANTLDVLYSSGTFTWSLTL